MTGTSEATTPGEPARTRIDSAGLPPPTSTVSSLTAVAMVGRSESLSQRSR